MTDAVSLSEAQERFVQEYMVDGNAAAAAARSGYDAVHGQMLLDMPEVQARIKAVEEEIDRRAAIKAAWVTVQLKTIVERCMQPEPVMERGKHSIEIDPFGEVRAVFKLDARGATKALELLGKQIGIFADNVNMKHSGEVAQKTDTNPNDLARRVAFLLQKAMRQRLKQKAKDGASDARPH